VTETGQTRAPGGSFGKLVAASSFGTVIEWYDFYLYAFLAPLVFDELFFPRLDPFVGSLAVFATLAVGFVARPVGGVVFGDLGDRIGRKAVLVMGLGMMGLCTAAMGVLPTYDTLGVVAPILLVSLRFCQGFAIGGQQSSAMVITVESAPTTRRGLFGAVIQSAGYGGVILASAAVAVLSLLSREDLLAWGWRLPFLASIVLVGVALYIRNNIEESRVFEAVAATAVKRKPPVLLVLTQYPVPTLIVTLVAAAEGAFYNLVATFSLAYGVRALGHPQGTLANAVVIGSIIGVFTTPFIGALSDRLGRRPMLLAGLVAATAFIPVSFGLMQPATAGSAALAIVIGVGLIHPLMFGPEGSFMAELFDTPVRMTGMSIGKQMGAVLGAGFAPLIAAWLIGRSDGQTWPVWIYFAGLAVLACVAALFAKETAHTGLGSGRAAATDPAAPGGA